MDDGKPQCPPKDQITVPNRNRYRVPGALAEYGWVYRQISTVDGRSTAVGAAAHTEVPTGAGSGRSNGIVPCPGARTGTWPGV